MKHVIAISIAALLAGPAVGQDWTGPYAGLSIGAGTGEGTHSTPWSTFGTASTDATEYGVLLGYAMQAGQWVWGPEAQFMLGGGGSTPFTHSSGTSTMTLETQSVSTLSVRAGRAFDRFMVSGSLGFAWASVDASYTVLSVPQALVLNDELQGYVVGVAGDYDLGNGWRVRGEYRHFDGFEASNPDTYYPGAPSTYLSEAVRDYDRQDLTMSIIRDF